MTFATAYLTIFLSHITNIQLMREFLFYLTLGRCDGKSVLNYLINNIASTNVKVLTPTQAENWSILNNLYCISLVPRGPSHVFQCCTQKMSWFVTCNFESIGWPGYKAIFV